MRSRRFEILAFCAMLFAVAALFVALQSNTRAANASAAAEVQQSPPPTLNYQGFLHNPDGSRMNGSHTITITVYDAATDGNALHSETFIDVPVRDGLFNAVLGDNDNVPLPAEYGKIFPIYIGIKVNPATEDLSPRQHVHPVPWALFAETAKTLVPDASIEGLTLNGETKIGNAGAFLRSATDGRVEVNGLIVTNAGATITGNTNVHGNTNLHGYLKVNDLPPILVKKYHNIIIPTSAYFGKSLSTGISADDYTCTMGGWQVEMDIDETGAGRWSRWLFTGGINSDWRVRFTSNTHSSTPTRRSPSILYASEMRSCHIRKYTTLPQPRK